MIALGDLAAPARQLDNLPPHLELGESESLYQGAADIPRAGPARVLLGSYEGAIVGSIVIGLIDNYGTAYFPAVAYSVLFIPVIAILLVRPHGLFGRATT